MELSTLGRTVQLMVMITTTVVVVVVVMIVIVIIVDVSVAAMIGHRVHIGRGGGR